MWLMVSIFLLHFSLKIPNERHVTRHPAAHHVAHPVFGSGYLHCGKRKENERASCAKAPIETDPINPALRDQGKGLAGGPFPGGGWFAIVRAFPRCLPPDRTMGLLLQVLWLWSLVAYAKLPTSGPTPRPTVSTPSPTTSCADRNIQVASEVTLFLGVHSNCSTLESLCDTYFCPACTYAGY